MHNTSRAKYPTFLVVFALLMMMAWGCKDPTPDIVSSLPKSITARACPAALFQANPNNCQGNNQSAACQQSCTPNQVAANSASSASSANFAQECKKKFVLCVGAQYPVKTITAAASIVQQDQRIKHVLIAAGQYNESATFQNISRPLLIEGASSDPQQGTRIEAPAPSASSSEYASLRFINVDNLTIKNLSASGQGHGLFVRNSRAVTITNDHLTTNALTGATLVDNDSVTLDGCRVLDNGGSRTSGSYQNLRFGVVIERARQVTVRGCEIARNGAGGLYVSPESIAVTITNDHIVTDQDDIAVTITNDHLTMEGNSIHHNGPTSWFGNSSSSCSSACSSDRFCEGGVCHVKLLQPINPGQTPTHVVGAGVYLKGFQHAKVRGNSFFNNDTTGLIAHSIRRVDLSSNVFERNGVRANATPQTLNEYAYPAAQLRFITQSVLIQRNLVVDNVSSGIQLSQSTAKGNTRSISVVIGENNFSNNGGYLTETMPSAGDGFTLLATEDAKLSVRAEKNYFSNNKRAGFFSRGPFSGTISSNEFRAHPMRALVLLETGSSQQQIDLMQNLILDAHIAGIQVRGGNAKLKIQGNQISNIQTSGGLKAADAINLTKTNASSSVLNNAIYYTSRAGVLLDAAKADLNNNVFFNNMYPIVTQNQAAASGGDSSLTQSASPPLENKKLD